MRVFRWSWAVAACTGALLWSNDSFGQASAVAEKLFRQAVDYMKAGDFASACPMLDRSYQLDPKDGTLFTLANCRDREEKLTLAAGHYRAYLRAFEKMMGATRQQHKARADIATGRVAEIEAVLPKIKFVWETPPPKESKIYVDGDEFLASTLDVLLPLDPGTHKIVIQLPGEPERTRMVTLEKGGSTIIDLTPAKPQDTATKPVGPARLRLADPKYAKTAKVDPVRVAGFVGMGLGVTGLIAGGATGLLAIQQKAIVDERCNANHVCDVVGYAAVERFRTLGNVSTASFIAGGVLGGVGVTLFLVSRRPQAKTGMNWQVRPAVSPGHIDLTFEGAF